MPEYAKSNYLSKRGYVLRKINYNDEELSKIKLELRGRPLMDNKYAFSNSKGDDTTYPVYMDTRTKLYIPKMYGIEKFGFPEIVTEYFEGKKWEHDIEFKGQLLEHQIEPVNTLIKSCHDNFGGVLTLPTGFGKCHAKNTTILMYDGTIKMVQDIRVGDLLMGDDSMPRKVLSLAGGIDDMYDIIQMSGDKYTVNKEHILVLKNIRKEAWITFDLGYVYVKWWENNSEHSKKFDNKYDAQLYLEQIKERHQLYCEIEVKHYMEQTRMFKRHFKGYKVSVEFTCKNLDMDPYRLGYWLGNDNSCNVIKHIPYIFKCNSRSNRLKLLAGLLDANGYYYKGMYEFSQYVENEQLIDDIMYLCRSLGFVCYKNYKNKKSGIKMDDKKRLILIISGDGIEDIPVLCKIKKTVNKKRGNDVLLTDINVQYIGKGEYYGFTIDGNHRYLLSDFTVTHNTVSLLYVLSQLKGKTIVVVNKIPLMNQWISEISKFLPDAKVGIIQGQKNVDVNGCDIVVAMLQSMAKIDYPDELFREFNTSVIDECFPYETNIITSHGSMNIGLLYYMKERGENLPMVKTFNEKKKIFELKKIVNVFRKKSDSLIEIQCGKMTIRSTDNHKYLTHNGWKEAKNIIINDYLLSNYSICSESSTKLDYGYLKVTKIITNIKNYNESEFKQNYVFDMEIEENHNYIVSNSTHVSTNNNIFNGFVVHNCHNISSKVFSKILFKLCCKYTIGLSATPKRSDGCEYVFKWHLGDIIYESSSERKGKPPIIRYLKIDSKEYREIASENRYTGQKQIQFTSMLSELVDMKKRNELIISIIKDLIGNDDGRKILVLSDRRHHLHMINSLLDEDLEVTFTYGLFLGGMKQKELDKSRKCQIILATYQAFGEGVSEKDLDTLLLVTPKKFIGHLKNTTKNESGKLEQIVGRIFRKEHIQRHPLIIDFQDNFSVYKNQASQRKNFYKQHFTNYNVEECSINLDNVHNGNYISHIKMKKTKKDGEENINITEGLQYCMLDD